jgi:hypothetical protein
MLLCEVRAEYNPENIDVNNPENIFLVYRYNYRFKATKNPRLAGF